jgi:sulfonate transport system permease protein
VSTKSFTILSIDIDGLIIPIFCKTLPAAKNVLTCLIPIWGTGLRSGLALGWMFVIAAELMGASEGLGYLMIDGQMTGRPALIIGALILFAMIGKLTDELIYVSAKPFLKWKVSLDTMQEEETNA